MKKISSLLLYAFILVTSIFAGPFGLEKGMSYEQVKDACGGREPVSISDGRYLIIPTKPHPYFTRYVAWIDEKEGLNYIKAIGANIETSSYGFDLKSKFNSLEESLSKTYGRCERIDTLLPGSIWDDADDWMKALEKKERYLISQWDKKSGSNLPDTINGIYLVANADGYTTGFVTLEYEFVNHEKVETAKKAEEDSVF